MKKAKSQRKIASSTPLGPTVSYTSFNGIKDPRGHQRTVSLSDFCLAFTKHLLGRKEGIAFAPVIFEGGRKKEDVRWRTMVIFDIEKQHDASNGISDKETLGDNCPPPLSTIGERAKALGVACIGYTTFTHDPSEPRYRIILPLEQPSKAGDPEDPISHARLIRKDALAVQAVSVELGLKLHLDVGKTLANSIFFLPRVAPENLHLSETFSVDGKLLNFNPYLDIAEKHVSFEEVEAERVDSPHEVIRSLC